MFTTAPKQKIDVVEGAQLSSRISPVAERLASEYWTTPEHDEWQELGIDVGRSIFYTQAVLQLASQISSNQAVRRFIKERREGDNNPLYRGDGILVPFEPDMRTIAQIQQYEIVLDQKPLDSAKAISTLAQTSLGQSLRIAARHYLHI